MIQTERQRWAVVLRREVAGMDRVSALAYLAAVQGAALLHRDGADCWYACQDARRELFGISLRSGA